VQGSLLAPAKRHVCLGVASLSQAALAARVRSGVPNTKVAAEAQHVHWGYPAHMHHPQRHVSQRGFSLIIITIFKKNY